MRSLIFLTLCSSWLLGCGGDGGGFFGGGLASVSTSTCTSGLQWQGGREGSSSMQPGEDCVACHASGEGPNYAVAGTVYKNANEASQCGGVNGVTVEITGADQKVTTLTTNEAGNFYSRGPIAMPYTVKLTQNGQTRIMAGAQTVGGCNSCHTQTGTNAAPGRIMAP